MSEAKYIIVRYADGKEYPIIFPKPVVHRDVAAIHSAMSNRAVVSAGFCLIDEEGVEAYGESESLRIQSRPEDAEIIRTSFGISKPKEGAKSG